MGESEQERMLIRCLNCGPQFHRLIEESPLRKVWACPTCKAKWAFPTELGVKQGRLREAIARCHSRIYRAKKNELKKQAKDVTVVFKNGKHFNFKWKEASWFIRNPIIDKVLEDFLGFNEHGYPR